jgi:hypothetical protein
MEANGDVSSPGGPKPSLLGISLRACNPAHALESVYHVLDVLEGSPAEVSEFSRAPLIVDGRARPMG